MSHLSFVPQIIANCDISDAGHAGRYSVCGLALRLRDLYKWDHGIAPWQEDASARVLEWIGEKEDLWDELAETPFQRLDIDGRSYDPFDTRAINQVLIPLGYFYGAGYAHSLKPTFFLARVLAREFMDHRTVWYLGREYARDLATLPAFCQDDEVVLRTAAARMYLWDQMVYLDNSARPALKFALQACCGLTDTAPDALRGVLEEILKIQQEIYLRHEIGELADTVFHRQTWRQMVADHVHTPVELLVRMLKDMLADTDPQGTLPYLLRNQDAAGFGFYMAFSPSITLRLYPELKSAFADFVHTRDWPALDQCVAAVRGKTVDYTGEILSFQRDGNGHGNAEAVRPVIEETMRRRGLID